VAGKIDLDDVLFAVCLDSLGRPMAEGQSGLYAHVSRPPKEGQATFDLFNSLQHAANLTGTNFETIHKKINLASEHLAWDHERFSLNKISAVTLSHFKSFKDSDRSTITDTIENVNKKILLQNIQSVVKGLAEFVYKNDQIGQLFTNGELDVSSEFVSTWLETLCGTARAAQLLNKNHKLVTDMFAHFGQYLQESVKLPVKLQAKEPEFVFYNQEEAKLIIYM